jgi:deazaflavin-dependent oxidoreductase (nitroreductase family)
MLFRFVYMLHIYLYQLTGGRIGGRLQGLPILLLTTTGRKTGTPRTTPLTYFPHAGGYVIVGSNAGYETDPAWFRNLSQNPHATVQIMDRRLAVRAEVAGPEVRDALWAMVTRIAPLYERYAKKTSRQIPLVTLRPQKG